jgi:hypothetical protein
MPTMSSVVILMKNAYIKVLLESGILHFLNTRYYLVLNMWGRAPSNL